MRADDFRKILKNISDLPYKTILVDGDWGIGKSYEVEYSLKGREYVYMVSLFGLHESQALYHELYSAIGLLKDSLKVFEKVGNAVREAITATDQGEAINKAVGTFITEKDIVIKKLGKQKDAVVVLDDLERISENIQIQEILGIVEEIKRRTLAKVILIANIEEMEEENKIVFNRFCEKIIDRKFHITEPASDVQWDTLEIDENFITDFLRKHKVKNIRTLQKAKNFFDDVRSFMGELEDVMYLWEIQKICFAIVVEDIEKLYLQKYQVNEGDSNIEKTLKHINQDFLCRVKGNYLMGIQSSDDLIKIIYKHYTNETVISSKEIEKQYHIFKHSDEKPLFYKSEEEVRELLPRLKKDINETVILGEFIRKAQSYLRWAEILNEDRTQMYDMIRSKAEQFMQEGIENGKILNYGEYGLLEMDLPEMKSIYREEYKKGCRKYVEKVIETILESIDQEEFKTGFQMSYTLKDMVNNTNYRAYVTEFIPSLLTFKILPVGSITDEQYCISYNILSVLYKLDQDRYKEFLETSMGNMDCVSRYRVEHIKKDIEENE